MALFHHCVSDCCGGHRAGASSALASVEQPVNLSPPTIGGKAREGSRLKVKKGEWSGGSLVYDGSVSTMRSRSRRRSHGARVPCGAVRASAPSRYVDHGPVGE